MVVQAGFTQLLDPVLMCAAAAHRPDVRGRHAQGGFQQRHVELGFMGEDADDRALVGIGAAQVAVRPVDDDFDTLREALGGGEDRPGVADGDPVAEEGADARDGRGEVDRPENQHARGRCERLEEDGDVVLTALAAGAVVPATVAPCASSPRASAVTAASRPSVPRVPETASGHTASVAPRGAGPSVTVAVTTGRRAATEAATSAKEGSVAGDTGRTSRVISPPQVRPTAKASAAL